MLTSMFHALCCPALPHTCSRQLGLRGHTDLQRKLAELSGMMQVWEGVRGVGRRWRGGNIACGRV